MYSHPINICPDCLKEMRCINAYQDKTSYWCPHCEGGTHVFEVIPPNVHNIGPVRTKTEKALSKLTMEMLKAIVFVIAGYAWAASAYGVLR